MPSRFVLLILDGWGIGESWGGNAILVANTTNYNRLIREYPNTAIMASGESVGLPGHEVGNSEVGHMNLGAGNIVEQDISLINKRIADGSFYTNKTLRDTISKSKEDRSALHLLGIISDGGIHSHINHLFALLKIARDVGHKNVHIHAFTDGRDTPTQKGLEFVNKIQYACEKLQVGNISTICGRVFLDRKGNWARTKVAYDSIVDGVGIIEKDPRSAISNAYKSGQTDEYIIPRTIKGNFRKMKDNDAVIFFNFRSDRTRQLTQAFLDSKFTQFKRRFLHQLDFVTFIPYGVEMEIKSSAKPAFPSIVINNTLTSLVSQNGHKQIHIAETEKFAHVTYFFNGNKNDNYKGEDRVLIPSPDVDSYATVPEMSIKKVTDSLITSIGRKEHQFMLCNIANGDMVGHTGDFRAALAAVESIDMHLKDIVKSCIDNDTKLIITADHGNIEQMVDPETGQPDVEHTKNPVPLILVSSSSSQTLAGDGILANVASTLLKFSENEIPEYFKGGLIT